MSELGTRTLRVKLDTSVALPSNLDIASWRGNALDLEVAIYDADGVAGITDITSVNVKVQSSQTVNTTLMDSTVAAASMDAALTAATWTDGTAQHATLAFTNAQANLTITDALQEYWIVFSALMSDSSTVTLAAGKFILHEDIDTTAGEPDVNPGTAITLEEADARYAVLGSGGAGWELKTADFTAEANGKYIIGDKDITVTPSFSADGELFELYMHDPTSPDVGSFTVFSYDGASFTARQFKDSTAYAAASHTHTLSDISDAGTAAAAAIGDFATAAQGSTADSAVQPASTDTLTNKTIAAGSNTITGITNQILHVREEQTSGTNGGSSVIGANTRVLNTVLTNNIAGASVAANVVTLPAGTYLIEAKAPVYFIGTHQLYLHNDTDTANELIGNGGYTNTSAAGEYAHIRGVVTIASPKAFTLRHWTQKAKSANGLGVQVASGLGEVYSDFMATLIT